MIEYVLIFLYIAFVLLIFLKTRKQEKERQEQEAYKKIDTLGGTEHIKQQLKTKSAEEIAQIVNITTENLNQYCQKKGTNITQLQKEIEQEKIQEAYETIDKLGGVEYIKQQLKTKSSHKIAEKYNITTENLNQYCQKHGTNITQLQKEIEQERQRKEIQQQRKIQQIQLNKIKEQQLQRKPQQRQQRQDKTMQNLKKERKLSGY